MDLVVFSSSKSSLKEVESLVQMFREGLQVLHLRKPDASKKELREFLQAIPSRFHSRIVLHSHFHLYKEFNIGGFHLSRNHRRGGLIKKIGVQLLQMRQPTRFLTRSCHRLSSLQENNSRFEYMFLSPTFESISKSNYRPKFQHSDIAKSLKFSETKVYALGGVNPDNLDRVKKLGFDGAGLLGCLWAQNQTEPIKVFRQAKEILTPELVG